MPASATALIGTYTERLPHVDGHAAGLLRATLDPGTGQLSPPRDWVATRNPSWVTVDRSAQVAYCVNETTDFLGQAGGGVSAFPLDLEGGPAEPLSQHASGGAAPCHVALDPSGAFVLVANYESGSVAVFSRRRDGSLAAMTDYVQHEGRGVHPVRQTGPHAHQAVFDPVAGTLLVPDLGLDAILRYSLSNDGRLHETGDRISFPAGAGPRHVAFHPAGTHLFVLNELGNSLTALERAGGTFRTAQTISTLPGTCTGHSQAAALRVSPSGRIVYASNRGHDSIAMFRFGAARGVLSLASVTSTQGREPRDFILTPDGRYLLVANQDSDSILTLRADEDAATLEPVGMTAADTPVCLLVLDAGA